MQILQVVRKYEANQTTMQTEFRGTDRYIATEELMAAVNAAMVLSRPLLIKGEPGTGKTLLAAEIARALSKPLYEWHIKSTTKAQQGLYEYDAVSRLRDSQLGRPAGQGHPQLHRARATSGRPSTARCSRCC